MPHFSIPELIIIMVVILLLFGAKRIPEIAGSMGKGIKEFKKQITDAERSITGNSDGAFGRPRLTEEDLQARPSSTEQAPEPKRLIS
jgi:sec-independent protein translocase protein TatA